MARLEAIKSGSASPVTKAFESELALIVVYGLDKGGYGLRRFS